MSTGGLLALHLRRSSSLGFISPKFCSSYPCPIEGIFRESLSPRPSEHHPGTSKVTSQAPSHRSERLCRNSVESQETTEVTHWSCTEAVAMNCWLFATTFGVEIPLCRTDQQEACFLMTVFVCLFKPSPGESCFKEHSFKMSSGSCSGHSEGRDTNNKTLARYLGAGNRYLGFGKGQHTCNLLQELQGQSQY